MIYLIQEPPTDKVQGMLKFLTKKKKMFLSVNSVKITPINWKLVLPHVRTYLVLNVSGALREFGEHLATLGHSVTQIKFKVAAGAKEEENSSTGIEIVDLPIKCSYNFCADYVNERGEFDAVKKLSGVLWRSDDFFTFSQSLDFALCTWWGHYESLMAPNNLTLIKAMSQRRFDAALVDLKVRRVDDDQGLV